MVIAVVWLVLVAIAAATASAVVWRRGIRPRALMGIIGAVIVVMAVLLGYRETVRLEWYLSTSRWPVVTGRVISAEIVGERAFAPRVEYNYPVGDSVYSGVTDLGVPSFGNKNVRLDVAEKTIADYKRYSTVVVHYNPDNPRESRLKASVPWDVYARLSTAICLSLGGVVLVVITLIGRRRKAGGAKTERRPLN